MFSRTVVAAVGDPLVTEVRLLAELLIADASWAGVTFVVFPDASCTWKFESIIMLSP